MPSKGRGSLKSKAASHDLFSVLKGDHRKVQKLFQQILKSHRRSDDTFAEIQEALRKHMEAEEKYFYPALEREQKARGSILEAYEEHETGKELIKKMAEKGDDERWLARVKVLSDIIDHHVEEEEGMVFRQAKRLLGREQTREIAEKILQSEGDGGESEE